MGLNFLRFSDREVRNNINKVLKEIENHMLHIMKCGAHKILTQKTKCLRVVAGIDFTIVMRKVYKI